MKQMKKNLLLIPFIVALTFMTVAIASAGELAQNVDVEFNGVTLNTFDTMAAMAGDTVPVRVTFEALADMDENVEITVELKGGHNQDVSASIDGISLIDGVTYTYLLSLDFPSDLDDLSEVYTLYVEIASIDDQTVEKYKLTLQRESYTLDILSADYTSSVDAGDVFPVSVVAKNNGYNRADDVYVRVSIPALGISSQGYLGDLVPVEDYDG